MTAILHHDDLSVTIERPDVSSPAKNWLDNSKIASVVPGDHNSVPSDILSFKSYQSPNDWSGQNVNYRYAGPIIGASNTNGKKLASGTITVENGRVWVVHPTNQFGGYSATFPKGKLEYPLSLPENAVKETYEETGLLVEILRHAIDIARSTSYTRYYFAERVSGHPADMGWESQKVSLVPIAELHTVCTHLNDAQIVDLIQKEYL